MKKLSSANRLLTGQAFDGVYHPGHYRIAPGVNGISDLSTDPEVATRVSIPPPGTHNDDLRPTGVAPRNVIDPGFGVDNLLRRDRYKVQLSFTVLNITGTSALYNFLSSFSGTHFVTPHTVQSEVRLVF